MKREILLIDDNTLFIENFKDYTREIFEVVSATTAEEGLTLMRMHDPDVVLLDLFLKEELDGLAVLREILHFDPDMPVIIVTDYANHESAVQAMQLGAVYYTSKAPNMETLKAVIEQQVRMLPWRRLYREQQQAKFGEMIGQCQAMQKVREKIQQYAATDMPVLILGESGTGKELVAYALHRHSRRASKPMQTVNCSTLAPHLFESEFFGHQRGAFTSAYKTRRGKFELADSGTLFLDEIGDLSLESQPKILEAIEYKRFWRLGSEEQMHADVRLIAATNKDLQKQVAEGRFREDLYYRLKVLDIELPPLRERRGDLPDLTKFFMEKVCREIKRHPLAIPDAVLDYWQSNDWPGNVRELRHTIERVALEATGQKIRLDDVRKPDTAPAGSSFDRQLLEMSYAQAKNKLLENFKVEYIRNALKKNNNNVAKTAEEIGVNRSTVYRVLKNAQAAAPHPPEPEKGK
jgi:two-component system nitrogen regulation response regulator NtrX